MGLPKRRSAIMAIATYIPTLGLNTQTSWRRCLWFRRYTTWGRWLGEPVALEGELKAGLRKFFDPKLETMRRYLPNVGKDRDADAVDSWYLYHPLINLENLALDGDAQARAMLLDSLDYAISAAHHFDYKWPVQFKVPTFR